MGFLRGTIVQEEAKRQLGSGWDRVCRGTWGGQKLREQMERQAHRVTGYEVGMRTGEAKERG